MEKIVAFIREHKWTVLLVAIGLILAILFMSIGFWKTLLLFAILAVCFVLGILLDQGGPEGVKAFFVRLFTKDSKK